MSCSNEDNEASKAILLDEESFRCLISGGIVHYGKIRIALSDIGYSTMIKAIVDAQGAQTGLFKICKSYIED